MNAHAFIPDLPGSPDAEPAAAGASASTGENSAPASAILIQPFERRAASTLPLGVPLILALAASIALVSLAVVAAGAGIF